MAKKELKNLYSESKKFINKGNIIDLAIGIIIGTAFTAIVNSLVNDIIMPLISNLIEYDLSSAKLVLQEAILDEEGNIIKNAITLNYGMFIQYVINFFVIAISIFLTIKIVKRIRKTAIERKIKYVLALKEKHPELFDEKGEIGTVMYEKIKLQHPEYFKDPESKEIDEKTEPDYQKLELEMLNEINNNLIKLNEKNDKNHEID